jgi:nitrate/nitrite-specific signal transduction histidine kinase/type II secretory pathway pseudopilin PulG
MVRFFSSLRIRLMLLVLLALVPSLGLIIYTDSEERRSVANQAQDHALQIARDAAQSQQDLIESTHQFLSVLAQLPAVRDLDPVVCSAFLADFLNHYPRYTSITVRSAKDNIPICRATLRKGPAPTEPGLAHIRALETRDFAIGDFALGPTSGKATLGFGYPIFDNAGQVQAILMVALDVDVLNQIAAQALLPPGATLMVNDIKGKVLVRYPNQELWVGKSAADAPVVKAILARKGEGTVQALGEDNVPRLYAFAPLTRVPTNDVYVSVGIPSEVAFAEVNQVLTRNLITLGLVAALALGAAWFAGDWFLLRQVKTLVSLTGRLAKGDLGARAGSHYSVGELGQLAQAFDQMGESLQQHEVARKQAEDKIRRWSEELERLMNAMSEAISQSLDVGKIAEIALTRTLSMMDLSAGSVFLRRGDTLALVANTIPCDEIVQRLERAQNCGQAVGRLVDLQSGRVEIISAEASETTAGIGEGAYWVRVPIKAKGKVFGVMCLACDSSRPLQGHEKGVLAAVGQQIGVAIENAELYAQVQSIAAVQERERLSRELHDGLAQVLGYLCIRTEVVRDLLKGARVDRAADELQEMQGAVQQAHQDLRESILGLRATIHPQGGLFSTLKEYLHKFSIQTGIGVNLISPVNGSAEFSPEAEVQLLRIIQEALANIRKHSDAKQAWIRFEPGSKFIRVTIQDDGKGFDPALVSQGSQPRFGLQTMQERAEGAGGSLHISSQPGQGATISVDLPIRRGGK